MSIQVGGSSHSISTRDLRGRPWRALVVHAEYGLGGSLCPAQVPTMAWRPLAAFSLNVLVFVVAWATVLRLLSLSTTQLPDIGTGLWSTVTRNCNSLQKWVLLIGYLSLYSEL